MHPLVIAMAIFLHILMFAAAIISAIIVHRIAIWLLQPLLRRTTHGFGTTVMTYCQSPVKWFLIVAACEIVLENIHLPEHIRDGTSHVLKLAMVVLTAWFALAFLHVCRDWILRRYEVTNPDNLHARRVHTQIKLLEKVIISLIILITLGCMLMTFDGIRQIGASLIASAGIAGVILGFAAQKVLASLLAGIQIAISEPFRIDDVVIVEGEWGQIEEITLTYIVVRVWDLRRLVLPMSYFIEKPFQNWTRTSADLLGTSFFYLDVATDIAPIRAEFERLVKASPRWDGKVQGLQVTNISERTIEVRCLMSSANASISFDLRCEIREKLLDYLRKHQPESFPRTRIANDPLELLSPPPSRISPSAASPSPFSASLHENTKPPSK